MSEQPAIIVKNVKKSFKIPLDGSSGIKQHVVNFYKHKKGYRTFTALDGVSFEIQKGDFFGIVGRNGSGKSTLLKMLAGVYTPDSGAIAINGSLTPFIELGVGFNPELTGRENVFLNGALLGFSRKEMQTMYEEIVDFAELHEFMEEKLKNYSSGMQVRLAFSIAIRADTDILLLDEVLAVGDEAFQKKCFEYFAELKKKQKTVILVTHDMDAVQRFCNKAIMIEKGHVIEQGNPSNVAQKYREIFMKDEIKKSILPKNKDGVIETETLKVDVGLSQTKELLNFDIKVSEKIPIEKDAIIAFGIVRSTGEQVYRWASDDKIKNPINFKQVHISVQIDNIFPEGVYTILLVVKSRDRSKDYGTFNDILEFEIKPHSDNKWDTFWRPAETYYLHDEIDGGK